MPSAPNHLAVYLTNRCNLSCDYCYVSVNQGPATRLSLEDLKRTIDYFFESVPGNDKKITFLGGEPFLSFPLFEGAVRHARERGGPETVLQTFTNGTLLTPERLAFLNEFGVHATISLDGKKETNDAHRSFFSDEGRSVFDEVMRRLEGLPLDTLGVSLVFTAATVEKLLDNVDYFRRLGFGRITFNPELYEQWPEDRLAVLGAVMKGFKRYYRRILETAPDPFVIQILFAILEARPRNEADAKWWHDCHNVVLGPDKKFYACDKALSFPIGSVPKQQVGSEAEGMDWDARQALFQEAAAFVEKEASGRQEAFCPMGVYFHSNISGREPVAALNNFHRVADLFAGGLAELIDEVQDHPAFQRLYVQAHLV